ncbi:hypothetical protein TNCV_3053391 [Trichonephila clavipes]|uniref:Uncharacterized protein n=1 Tax=Trichonephila clavipes TaxID=2585209 RepID=A0A8X6RV45_TRICX|nr:hypothetical protein TNCV_3053391 [Trichonephila clavipes]
MVQRSREKEQKQQLVNEAEDILLKGCTTTGVRKCMFFFYSHMKSLEYEMLVPSVEDLLVRISSAAERVCDIPRTFQNVRNFMQFRSQVCQTDFWL